MLTPAGRVLTLSLVHKLCRLVDCIRTCLLLLLRRDGLSCQELLRFDIHKVHAAPWSLYR